MNVIWIEDFGKNLLSPDDATVNHFFSFLLPSEMTRNDWLKNGNLKTDPGRLERACLKFDSSHLIRLFTQYWEFCGWILESYGLHETDVVLIDLNLVDGFLGRDPPPELVGKTETAGFKLFHFLTLECGFPAERIAFLTANSNDVDQFDRHSKEHHFPPLTCFGKDDVGRSRLKEWLLEFAQDPFVNLRRGLLDGLLVADGRRLNNLFSPKDIELSRQALTILLNDKRVLAQYPEAVAHVLCLPWDKVDSRRVGNNPMADWMKQCRNAIAHGHFELGSLPERLALIALAHVHSLFEASEDSRPSHAERKLAQVAVKSTHSEAQSGELRRKLVGLLTQSRRLKLEHEGDCVKLSTTGRYRTSRRSDDNLAKLAGFALEQGIANHEIKPLAFAYYAAGLWEKIPEEFRDSSAKDGDEQNFWALLERSSKSHF